MCNDCGEIKNNKCGCGTKVDLKCTFYDGSTLEPLHILNGMNGEEIVVIINNYLKDLILELEPEPTILQNVGTGAELYKGFSLGRRHEIKTLLEGEGIILTETDNSIEIKVSQEFIESITGVNIESVGEGAPVYIGEEDNIHKFRELTSSDSSVAITIDEDNQINLTVEKTEVDYPVIDGQTSGTGIPIYKGLTGKKIDIASLYSDDFIITEFENGVKINSPGGGSNSEYWYLDATFSRPVNWGSRAELIDGLPTAKGTLNDPFKTYEEFLRRCVGETGGSNANGPYSRVNPKQGAYLRILSDLVTDKILEINNCGLDIMNNKTIIYTGSEEYAINVERLWDAMPKTGGVIDRPINFTISGEGSVVNKFHAGILNHKTSVASTVLGKKCMSYIIARGQGLNFIEQTDSANYTPLTKGDGITPVTHGGIQILGSTKVPTTPLLRIKGANNGDWGAVILGTKFNIQTNIQSHIEVDAGSLTSSADEVMYMTNATHIGYETKLYTGKPGMTANETELLNGRGGIFFKPYTGRNVFSSKNGSQIRLERISTLPDQKIEIGANSIFHIENGSTLSCLSKFEELGGGSAVSYINSIGNGNAVDIYNASQSSYTNYFAKGDGVNNINVTLVSSQVNPVDIIKKDTPLLNLNTSGTFSTLKARPINTQIIQYPDNATAVLAGLIPGMLYHNTTEDKIKLVF